jgi:hypothetical protein
MALAVAGFRLGMNGLHVTSVPLLTAASIALGAACYFGLLLVLCRPALEDLVSVLGKGLRR